MKMKEIASEIQKLPVGEYQVSTNHGIIEIKNDIIEDERFNNHNILIKFNNKDYIQIYRFRDQHQEIYFKTLPDGSKYSIIINYNCVDGPRIETTISGRKIIIKKNYIYIYDASQNKEYKVSNSIIENDKEIEEYVITYNLSNDEKTLYYRKNKTETYSESNSTNNFIKINLNVISVVKKYNKLVEMVNHSLLDSIRADEDLNPFKNELIALTLINQIPKIDFDEIKKEETEITKIAQIYKKYIPLLNHTIPTEMIEVLGNGVKELVKQHCNQNSYENKHHTLNKKFNINDYKSN